MEHQVEATERPGSVCWFEAGVTDSFGQPLLGLQGLGMLEGSHCPH